MPRRDDDLEAAIAALYQGGRADFLPARKALATRLRREGRSAEAAQVGALAKPTLSAWAVSHLIAREPRAMERLLAEGGSAREALRATLARGGDPGALRDAIERVRRAGTSLAQRAAVLAQEDTGTAPSAAIVDRIGTDLSALALSPSASEAASRGWIASDLDPPGLEILTELPPIARSAPSRRAAVARPRAAARAASAGRSHPRQAAPAERGTDEERAAERARARADERASKAAERERARAERAAERARERARRERLEEEVRRAEERAAELRRAAVRAAKLAEDAHRHAERARSAARTRR